MIPVIVTAERATRWWPRKKKKTWRRELPEAWSEIAHRRRLTYYRLVVNDARAGLRQVAALCLRLPAWALRAMRAEEVAALTGALAWMTPEADCERLPFPHFGHRSVTYHFPRPKGENMTCIEYPLADEYYMQFVQGKDDTALLMLTATLVREEHPDPERALREEDPRVPLHSRAEVATRANRLRSAPREYQVAALLFFAGMKQYVHRVYGPHLFDMDDEDDTEPNDDNDEMTPIDDPDAGFGWWGILQDVAEAGLFGTMKEVYQANFHEVCMFLVRQQIKARQMRAEMKPTKTAQNFD